MSSTNKSSISAASKPPKEMATEVMPLLDVAQILAKHANLEAGKYALVVEFKLGSTTIRDHDSSASSVPGMAIGVAGIGLAKTDVDGPMTIHYAGSAKKKPSKAKA